MTEPSADLRQFASFLRQMFVALRNEGFSEREALVILGSTVTAGFQSNGGGSS